jgi:hypothetical protein
MFMADLQNVRETHKINTIEKCIENVAKFKYLKKITPK